MTTSNQRSDAAGATDGAAVAPSPSGPPRPVRAAISRTGLSELVVPGILVAIAIFLIVGTVNMKLPPSVQVPGPTFFPMIIIGLLLLMAVLSTVQILRNRAQLLRGVKAGTVSAGFDDVDADPDEFDADAVDLDGEQVDEIPPDVPPGRSPGPPRRSVTGGPWASCSRRWWPASCCSSRPAGSSPLPCCSGVSATRSARVDRCSTCRSRW